jgi:FtsZ-interacting cell division protein ZipA
MTWLAIRTFVSGIPRWVWIAVALGIAALLFGIWLADRERKAVEADRSVSRGKVLERARDADERAHGAGEATREAIERSNADAKAASGGSDDPLRAAFDSLRSEKD